MKKANAEKYMLISMLANFLLSVLKIFFGILGGVKSLIADGIHSFSDLITDVIAIIGAIMAKKPADDDHPKGHGKIEYITSLIITIFILFLGFTLFKMSFSKQQTTPNIYLILVVVFTIFTKYLLSSFLIRKGEATNNMILISSGEESYTDVYSSLLVLVVLILSQFSHDIPILKYADQLGSLTISILILRMGIKLLFKNFSLLIGESETSVEKVAELKKIVLNRPQKIFLKRCTFLKLGSYYEVELEIEVPGNMTVIESHDLANEIEKELLDSDLNIQYVITHIEPIGDENSNARIARSRNRKRNAQKKRSRKDY